MTTAKEDGDNAASALSATGVGAVVSAVVSVAFGCVWSLYDTWWYV